MSKGQQADEIDPNSKEYLQKMMEDAENAMALENGKIFNMVRAKEFSKTLNPEKKGWAPEGPSEIMKKISELKGSIGEGPNHSNHLNHSNSFKIQEFSLENWKNSEIFNIFFQNIGEIPTKSDNKISSKSEQNPRKKLKNDDFLQN